MKTLEDILTETLKGKWIAGHLFDDTEPCFSGIVESIKYYQDSGGGSYIRFTLNTGKNSKYTDVYHIQHLKLSVC